MGNSQNKKITNEIIKICISAKMILLSPIKSLKRLINDNSKFWPICEHSCAEGWL